MKVPFLTTNQIERETNKLLADYAFRYGEIVEPPIDIEGIIESLLELDLRFDDLKTSLGQDVLGATWIKERKVRIDQSLDPTLNYQKEGRYRFTLAHEVGHWQLHRPIIEAKSLQHSLFDEATEPSIVCRSATKDPMEWQADSFAGYLLMPEFLVRQRWIDYNDKLETHLVRDIIESQPTQWSLIDSNTPITNVARELATVFNVSGQAMQIRLISLRLIQIERNNAKLFN